MSAKLKALERDSRELRQANEILRKVSAYFTMRRSMNTLSIHRQRRPDGEGFAICPDLASLTRAELRRRWRKGPSPCNSCEYSLPRLISGQFVQKK
jgi:hypothetical protein